MKAVYEMHMLTPYIQNSFLDRSFSKRKVPIILFVFLLKSFLADLEVHRKISEEMFETLLKNHMQVWQNLS